MTVQIIGGGLAGSEAAWQVARGGGRVVLWEMRPEKKTPAHRTGYLGELVCSNSLRGNDLTQAAGLLKEEMRRLGSLIMEAADSSSVPAGGALAVDREAFAAYITRALEEHPLVDIRREEVTQIPDGITLIAAGPLVSDGLTRALEEFFGESGLYFYDAAAPIVAADSIDTEKAFLASRYGKGEAAYLNCPMTEEEYLDFWEALTAAEVYPRHDFEEERFFEGCLPIEEMARRGPQTLLFGPLKPVGLVDPATGERPYAVVQLRPENRRGTSYNLVGFQTNLRFGEQQRVFRMIPGLQRAEFERYGVMHRNTFINSPAHLLPTWQTKRRPDLLVAGQISGVEGYIESAASGLMAGFNAWRLSRGDEPVVFPAATAHGALAAHVSGADPRHFQPMNINFGLLPRAGKGRSKKERRLAAAERALEELETFKKILNWGLYADN